MNYKTSFSCVIALCLLLALDGQSGAQSKQAVPQPLPVPSRPGSTQANFTQSRDGGIVLSWLEPAGGDGRALRYSTLNSSQWSSARTISSGTKFIRFWGELPAVHIFENNSAVTHWAAATIKTYDVNLAWSEDGVSWSEPVVPHQDGTPTEHGLISSLPWGDNGMLVTWLDGRNYSKDYHGPNKNATSLRAAFFTSDGKVAGKKVLDPRVCDCCPTASVLLKEGAIIAYRDRTASELRDIAVVRFDKNGWSEPVPVSHDGWVLHGCPVNGPAVSASGNDLVVAWFTAAQKQPAVKVSFSRDGGKSFSKPIRIDAGNPRGRTDIAILPNGDAMVAWVEQIANNAYFMLRSVSANGGLGQVIQVASQVAGMPRIAYAGAGKLLLAWTQDGKPSNMFTATLEFGGAKK